MATLEQMIAEAASKGGLTALTLWPCSGGWQCNARRRSKGGQEGWVCVTSADPVAGLKQALEGRKVRTAPPPDDEDLLV